MLPAVNRLSLRENEQMLVVFPYTDGNLHQEDPEYLTFSIDPKFVWKQTSTRNDSIPLTIHDRLRVIAKICEHIITNKRKMASPTYIQNMTQPGWRLVVPPKTLVYYQTSISNVSPEWIESDGALSIDETPEDDDAYVYPFPWLTYEWMQLPEDYRAFCIVNMVYRFMPSKAWSGLYNDLFDLCGDNTDCYIKNVDDINPTVSDRLTRSLSDLNTKRKFLETIVRSNYELFRRWVYAAFLEINPSVWATEWLNISIFEHMPDLMKAPRVPVTLYDRFIVKSLRDILEKAAAPDGTLHQEDRQEFESMMRDANLPVRRSRRDSNKRGRLA